MVRKGWILVLGAMLLGLLTAPPLASATVWTISIKPNLYGTLNQNILIDPLKTGGCAPVAVMNSFTYLQTQYPGVYGNSLTPNGAAIDVSTLAGQNYMNTAQATGTLARDIIWGTYLYMENFAPNKTIYAAETIPLGDYNVNTNPGGWENGRNKPLWVTELGSGPSTQFLYNELVKGEDVEIGIVRPSEIDHCLTLTGFTFDDAAGTGNIAFIDPKGGVPKSCNFIIINGLIYTDYDLAGTFNDYIGLAVAESPVPLPASMLLLGSGLLGLAGWRRFRKA